MTPRKKLEGALASWHPHPKGANNSLVPVVRDAPPADDVADRFFDSTPHGYAPEPQPADAVEATTRRAAIHSAAARERRRYLTRYVAGAVGVASVIGLGALLRVTTMRSASAAQTTERASSMDAVPQVPSEQAFGGSSAATELAATPPTVEPPAADPSAVASAAETAPVTPATTPTTDVSASPAAADPDPKAASDAKSESQRALERGRLKASIEAGERSVSLDPTDADAWLILGAAYEAHGSYADARRCFAACSKVATRGARGECRALLR